MGHHAQEFLEHPMLLPGPAAWRNVLAEKSINQAWYSLGGERLLLNLPLLTHAKYAVGQQCLDAAHCMRCSAEMSSVMNEGITDTTERQHKVMAR